jgi:hypothetical protein
MTEENETAGDRGFKDTKSLKRHKRETLVAKARARRSTTSDKSNKCKQGGIEEENC